MKQAYIYETHEISAVVVADSIDEAIKLTEKLKKNSGCWDTAVSKFDLRPISLGYSLAYSVGG